MFDSKVIRRRRATLAVFVGLSIAMLTAWFGESNGGLFHTLQRGAQEAFAPIETGTSRALKPFRDFFGWFGDTVDAKGDNEDLRREVQDLRQRLAENATGARDAAQLRGLVQLRRSEGFPGATRPVAARVIARSPTVWYSTVKIDRGSSNGVRSMWPPKRPIWPIAESCSTSVSSRSAAMRRKAPGDAITAATLPRWPAAGHPAQLAPACSQAGVGPQRA